MSSGASLVSGCLLLGLVRAGFHGNGGSDGYGYGYIGVGNTNGALRNMAKAAYIDMFIRIINKPDIISMKQEITREADYQDGDDCAKKFLCELSGPSRTGLEWHESLLFNVYNQPVLDYSSDSLFFNIAVKVGTEGLRACSDVYPKCMFKFEELRRMLQRQGLTFDVPGIEKDCQIYFLWTKKTREDPSEVSGRQEEISEPETESGSGDPTTYEE